MLEEFSCDATQINSSVSLLGNRWVFSINAFATTLLAAWAASVLLGAVGYSFFGELVGVLGLMGVLSGTYLFFWMSAYYVVRVGHSPRRISIDFSEASMNVYFAFTHRTVALSKVQVGMGIRRQDTFGFLARGDSCAILFVPARALTPHSFGEFGVYRFAVGNNENEAVCVVDRLSRWKSEVGQLGHS